MKRVISFLLILLYVTAVETSAAKRRSVEVKPRETGNKIVVMRSGKQRSYYQLSSKRSMVVTVKGPGDLRAITRAQFGPTAKNVLGYRLVYRVDGSDEHFLDVGDAVRSEDATYKDKTIGVPADSRELTLKVGRGYHSIEFIAGDSLPQVAVRFLFASRKEKKTKWVVLSPLVPFEPVDLLGKEETAHYYRFTGEKPLKVEIIGPTELRVLTRVENSYNMKGQANYRLQVRQNGQVLQSFQLSSRRSETTTYKKNSKLIPGKAREIVLSVPKGKHVYEIAPLDKRPLLGQIMFPKKDAKLGL